MKEKAYYILKYSTLVVLFFISINNASADHKGCRGAEVRIYNDTEFKVHLFEYDLSEIYFPLKDIQAGKEGVGSVQIDEKIIEGSIDFSMTDTFNNKKITGKVDFMFKSGKRSCKALSVRSPDISDSTYTISSDQESGENNKAYFSYIITKKM